MNTTVKLLATMAMLAVASAALAEKVYRWVDEKGGVHYSATPPPGMSVPPSELEYNRNPDPDAAARRLQQYQDNVNKRRETQAAAAKENAKAAAEASSRAQNCTKARDIVTRLRSGNPGTRYRREDGSYTRYDDAERARKIADAQAAIGKFCN
jgi:Domain of unknown function (DUF4124)